MDRLKSDINRCPYADCYEVLAHREVDIRGGLNECPACGRFFRAILVDIPVIITTKKEGVE